MDLKNRTILQPTPISETAVRIYNVNVRSMLACVRSRVNYCLSLPVLRTWR